MLEANRVENTNIVEARLDGGIEPGEVETLRSEIDAVLADHDKLRLLFVYEGLGSMNLQALWKDLKLEPRLLGDIEKMAVVSEKSWLGSVAGVLNSVMSIEVETFEPGRREEALQWLKT